MSNQSTTLNMKAVLAVALVLLTSAGAWAQTEDNDDVAQSSNKPKSKDWSKVGTIAIAPVQFSEQGVGVGLGYEHALEQKGIISVCLHSFAVMNMQSDNYGGKNGEMQFSIMPGFKFYPTGMGKVKYAVGASYIARFSKEHMAYGPTSVYDNGTGIWSNPTVTYGYENRFLMGAIINNSLNFQMKEHLYAGLELGIGLSFSEWTDHVNWGGGQMLMQGSFKIGYTF